MIPSHVSDLNAMSDAQVLLTCLPWEVEHLLLEAWPEAIDLSIHTQESSGTKLAHVVRMLQDHGLIMFESVDTSGRRGTMLRDLALTYKGREALRARHVRQ